MFFTAGIFSAFISIAMFTDLWTVQPAAGRDSVVDPGTGEEAVSDAAAAAAPAAVSPKKGPTKDNLKTDQAFFKGYHGYKQAVWILLCTAGKQRGSCSPTVISDFVLKHTQFNLTSDGTRISETTAGTTRVTAVHVWNLSKIENLSY